MKTAASAVSKMRRFPAVLRDDTAMRLSSDPSSAKIPPSMKTVHTGLFILLTLFTFDAMAQNIETQAYTVMETMGPMEIRHYPPVMKIQSDNNFNALFRYISGGNQNGTDISMTTPVYMGDSEGNRVMEFVLPATFKPGNTPAPTSSSVRVFESEPVYVAAIAFGGYASESDRRAYSDKLKRLAREHGLTTLGEPMLLVYNSPYQFFNRRNEILLKVEYRPEG